MKLILAKRRNFVGATLGAYALLTGLLTPLMMLALKAILGPAVHQFNPHTSLWAGTGGFAASVLSGFLLRLRLAQGKSSGADAA